MNFSFQTVLVGSLVTVVHVAAILVMKPATLEASKFFEGLKLDGFVEEFLVKKDSAENFSMPQEERAPMLAGVEEVLNEPSVPVLEQAAPSTPIESPEKFMNLEEERDSMKAVTDVRVFAGRIDEPKLEEYTSARVVAEPVAAPEAIVPAQKTVVKPAPEKKVVTPAKEAGPHRLRAIAPLTRS